MSLPKEFIQKALLLNNSEELNLVIKDIKKLNSFRTALYKAKKEFDTEDFITIKTKNNTIVLTKNKEKEDDFTIESFVTVNSSLSPKQKTNEVEEEEEEVLDLSDNRKPAVLETNIDGNKIKTIREKLSIFDKEKAMLAEQFKACKAEIESIEELSTEDKEFLISKSLEITNLSINHLNKKAKDLTLESKKSQ